MQEGNNYRDDVYSKPVRAGKRTYFFDVKSTRGNDLFMTITESKRTGSATKSIKFSCIKKILRNFLRG